MGGWGDEPLAMNVSRYARRLTGFMRNMLGRLNGWSKPAASAVSHRTVFETVERLAIVQVSRAAVKDDRETRAIPKGGARQIHLLALADSGS